MFRIGGIINEMNNRTFIKKRQINEYSFIDLSNKQRITVPLILNKNWKKTNLYKSIRLHYCWMFTKILTHYFDLLKKTTPKPIFLRLLSNFDSQGSLSLLSAFINFPKAKIISPEAEFGLYQDVKCSQTVFILTVLNHILMNCL